MRQRDADLKGLERSYQKMKKEQKRETKARRKDSGRDEQYCTGSTTRPSIVLITAKANITDRGTFVEEFHSVYAEMESMQANISNINASAAAVLASTTNVDEEVIVPTEILEGAQSMAKWQLFLLKSCEEGVKIEDPKVWPARDIINLLNQHGLVLQPFPNRRILDEIARELVNFRMACMSLLDATPSGEQCEALGMKTMGLDDENHRELIAKMNAPAKYVAFIADPQIPANFLLNKLRER